MTKRSKRTAALIGAWAMWTAAAGCGPYYQHDKAPDKRQPLYIKGMSAEELGTTGRRKSRRARKSKIQKEDGHGSTLHKRTGPGRNKRK